MAHMMLCTQITMFEKIKFITKKFHHQMNQFYRQHIFH